jgi:hypothetical protein
MTFPFCSSAKGLDCLVQKLSPCYGPGFGDSTTLRKGCRSTDSCLLRSELIKTTAEWVLDVCVSCQHDAMGMWLLGVEVMWEPRRRVYTGVSPCNTPCVARLTLQQLRSCSSMLGRACPVW